LKSKEVAEAAFLKAWEIRNFEIELYWKRATYFWAFVASSLTGYFVLVSSKEHGIEFTDYHEEVYLIISIGFILSLAWLLINKGSKSWQRHWEIHIDLLEDEFTGPLYKTVSQIETYSVSKINEIVSYLFVWVWLFLGIKYLSDHNLINFTFRDINYQVFCITFMTFITALAMLRGKGKGRFGERDIYMYRRKVNYIDPE
jgi:hypothetical protein